MKENYFSFHGQKTLCIPYEFPCYFCVLFSICFQSFSFFFLCSFLRVCITSIDGFVDCREMQAFYGSICVSCVSYLHTYIEIEWLTESWFLWIIYILVVILIKFLTYIYTILFYWFIAKSLLLITRIRALAWHTLYYIDIEKLFNLYTLLIHLDANDVL